MILPIPHWFVRQTPYKTPRECNFQDHDHNHCNHHPQQPHPETVPVLGSSCISVKKILPENSKPLVTAARTSNKQRCLTGAHLVSLCSSGSSVLGEGDRERMRWVVPSGRNGSVSEVKCRSWGKPSVHMSLFTRYHTERPDLLTAKWPSSPKEPLWDATHTNNATMTDNKGHLSL